VALEERAKGGEEAGIRIEEIKNKKKRGKGGV